ncbi:MAG: diguanylate cyclase [Nitrospirae bacterium]|nr:diguanylate cyclase [Nitrospirota bacterium]
MHTLTRLISEASDLHAALGVALQTIGEATGWMLGQAWIPNSDTVLECIPAWYGKGAAGEVVRSASETLTLSLNEGLPGRVWASKEPLWLHGESLAAIIPCGAIAHEAGLHAALGIPLLAAERVVAVLEFYLGEPRQEDTRLMGIVSNAALHMGDLIQKKRAEADLERQATHDALTDLYNRRSFDDRTAQELARAERHGHPLAFLLVDLDHFKAINDGHGHYTGDMVLKAVAQSILKSSRSTDLVFRWGGDEFVILLSEATREGVRTAATRIRTAVQTVANEMRLPLDLSIGIAMYPEHGRTGEELIRLADRALYLAKKSGDPIKIGEEDYQLTDHAVTVVFQPVMNIRTGQVIGYEALTRDAGGKLSVHELFAKYERIGKLQELKCLCFTAQLRKACEVGLRRVFLNVDFWILRHLVPPQKPPETEVILEISELEALDHVEERIEIGSAWRARGYKFAIDDFGAGYISLPFIARLIPEYIKIDRSTLLQAVSSPQFQEFMIGLVFALRSYSTDGIIIEGVETEQELEIAKAMGAFLIQGYLFGKPKEWDGAMLQQSPPVEDQPPQAA